MYLTVALALALLAPGLSGLAQTASPSSARQAPPADTAALERQLLDAARLNPDSFDAQHRLAGLYLQQGQVSSAIPYLERAQAIDPSHYASGYDLALALTEVGRLDDARAQVTRMLERKDIGELRNLLGDIEERAGRLQAAAEQYQRAAHMDPSEEHLFDWGNNLLRIGASGPALEVFTAAVARQPRSARIRVGLGIARYSLGEYGPAVEAFCEAADLAPLDPRPYQFLGEMYGVSPELSAQITARLARFVEARPDNALAHFHYAMSLWKGESAALAPDDLRRIEALLRRAVGLDPTLSKGFFQLGILLADQRRHADAIAALREATRLDPTLSQAHYRLGQLYQRAGEKELAAREFEIFRQLTSAARGK